MNTLQNDNIMPQQIHHTKHKSVIEKKKASHGAPVSHQHQQFSKSRSQKRKTAQSTRFNTLLATQQMEQDYNSIDNSLEDLNIEVSHNKTGLIGQSNFITAPAKNQSRKNVIPSKASNQRNFKGLSTVGNKVNSNYQM